MALRLREVHYRPARVRARGVMEVLVAIIFFAPIALVVGLVALYCVTFRKRANQEY